MSSATTVPRWTAASKARPWSGQPRSMGTRIRCPDEETGRNSVAPWTRPRTIAWRGVIAAGRPPLPDHVLAAVDPEDVPRHPVRGGVREGDDRPGDVLRRGETRGGVSGEGAGLDPLGARDLLKRGRIGHP